MILMKKKLLSACLICAFFFPAYSQNNEAGLLLKTISFHYSKEEQMVDSLKKLVKKGFVIDENRRNNGKKYSEFVNNCISIGSYYERLYNTHRLPNMKMALFYYLKVADMNNLPGDPKYYKGASVKTTLYRKLADIYFKGNGVKKDVLYSRRLALEGIGRNSDLIPFYSMRYYGQQDVFLSANRKYNYESGSEFLYNFNPFASKNWAFVAKTMEKKLEDVAKAYRVRNMDSKLKIQLTSYPIATMASQASCNKLMDRLKVFLIEKQNLSEENIITSCEVNDDSKNGVIEVRFIDK